ncbi:MAG: hypothetical protein M0R03_23420 [Novosphingobium sp.]|nr:hypothetical protein [Novosphingobium sp.]
MSKIRKFKIYKEFIGFYIKWNQNKEIEYDRILIQPEIRGLVISNKFIKYYKDISLRKFLKRRNIILNYKEFKKEFKMSEYKFNKMLRYNVIDFIFDSEYKIYKDYIINNIFDNNYRNIEDPKKRIEDMDGIFVEFLVLNDLLECYEKNIF